MTDTVSLCLFGSGWLENIGAVSTYVHCLHFSQHFGLFLSSHQNGSLIFVCTIPARHDEKNSSLFSFPAFSFKDTVNFSREGTAAESWNSWSQNPRPRSRESWISAVSVSHSLDSVYNHTPWDAAAYTLHGSSHPFNSDTEPPSQLCPEVYQHLDPGSVKRRTLSTTYVVNWLGTEEE